MANFRKVDVGVCKLEDIVGEQVKLIISDLRISRKKRFDPLYYIHLTVANIVLRIITGVTNKWDNEEFQAVLNDTATLAVAAGPAVIYLTSKMIMRLPIQQNYEIRRVLYNIFEFIKKTINTHKDEYDPSTIPKDFVESYLQETFKADVIMRIIMINFGICFVG